MPAMMDDPATYAGRIAAILAELGVPPEVVAARGLPLCEEGVGLIVAETDANGREYLLLPAAAAAWQAMRAAAEVDGVAIELCSAFRSVERQAEIIRAKLARGMDLATIFTLSAPPGYSEHHTGRAVDINTPGCAATEEEFELTPAYDWLCLRAGEFGFTLSYPRDNRVGFIYEPWHWCFDSTASPRL